MQEPGPAEPVEGAYRCTGCGHGKKLWAWAGCNAYGALSADGDGLDTHEDVVEWGIYEDSICCTEHGHALERFIGGRWCCWWACPKCGGGGVIKYGGGWDRQYTAECREETPFPARPVIDMGWDGIHEGWLPAEEFAVATAGDG